MTTVTITPEDAARQLLPHVDADFLKLYRALTLQLGFRQVGKALAAGVKIARDARKTPAPAYELTEADSDYIMGLEAQLNEAETFFQCYPLLDCKALRTVVRRRKRAGVLAKGFTRDSVEQLVVSPAVAETLHRDNRPVEFDKKTGKWWADCEDQAWGQDIYLEELFGGQAGRPGHTEDDILPMLRKAQEHRQNLKWINGEIARVQKEGV